MKRIAAALLVGLVLLFVTASGQQPGPPSVAGELLVKFRRGASQARRDNVLAVRGSQLLRRFATVDVHHVRIRAGQSVEAAIASLQADPDVELVQPNYIRHTTAIAVPDDPFFVSNSLWGLQQIQAQNAWSSFTTGDGSVVVADIDTGVNYLHPDLVANIWTNPAEIPGNGVDDDSDGYVDDVHGINVINHSGNPMDDHGHGTHTAGTMAAVGNNGVGVVGVNWNAKILACKFLNASGSGSDAGAVECLNYIVLQKQRGVNIRVSNNSWGGTRDSFPSALNDALNAAGTAGILNVCAAGNDNTNNDTTPFDPASLPATSIVSVAASEQSDGRAYFSNYGTSVHLAAPGLSIISTYQGGYGTLSGTSMAAPHVAGVAALVAKLHPSYSPETIKSILTHTVDLLPQWSGVVSSGGRLNAFKAATDAAANVPPTVSLTSPSNGATFTPPATTTLTATASDGQNPVTSVAFYANGSLLGTDLTSPFSTAWSNVGAGTYSLTAVATDYLGATTTSTPVNVTVGVAGSPQTLFTTQTPVVGDYADGSTYELGMRFVSDVAGQITAIRFWKTPTETGTHVGRIWTTGGAQLASVTFTGETGSGWQQQALTTPLTITAGTQYIVSVPTGTNGRLAMTINGLAPGVNNGPLHAQAGNPGRYGLTRNSFPGFADSTAYFRDIVFVPSGGAPDTTPPSISITQPASGSTVSGAVTIAATASDDIGVAGVQFQVDGINFGGEVTSAPYSVVWDSTTAANGSHALKGVARDAAGHLTPASVTVTVSNAPGSPTLSLLASQTPVVSDYVDGKTYELGMRFVSDVAGQVTAIRFWKTPTETGTHVGRIWTTAGALLASVTFTGETASGWQQQALAVPLAIGAGTEYIVSVPTGSNGHLAMTINGLASGVNNGSMHAPAGNSGRYGMTPNSFPGFADSTAYFRDIVFAPSSSGPDTTPPSVSITQPASGSTVSGPVTIAATASDDIGVAGVQFQIDGINFGGEVTSAPYSVVWNSTTVSNANHVLTAVARDAAGHTTPVSVTVTVNNGAGSPSQTLFTGQVPTIGDYADGSTYELGMRFVSDVAGQITAIRFWKAANETGAHVGRIWTTGGGLLASVLFTGETASGWQQQALATPLAIGAGTEYIVSVPTGSNGHLAMTINGLASGVNNGPLHAPAGNPGRYGMTPNSFPGFADSTAYFRDVVFVPGSGGPLAPAPVQPSSLTVRMDFAGQVPTHHNLTSAVVAGSQLLLVDQGGYVYRWDGAAHDLLTPADFPAGIFPPGGESVLNIASNTTASSLFVMFSTFTAPAGIPVSISPRPTDSWQVLYQYDFNGLALSNARAIRAFQVRSSGHTGGGLAVLNDGTVVCAIGDNGDAGEDGFGYAQDPTNHLAKVLRINPADASTTVLAMGVRNVQRLVIDPNGGDPLLIFADLGGYIAEEINSVRLADLLGAPSPLNFGWGRHADGKAREGTFYIQADGAAVGAAPAPEPGFVQPIAQFGREGATFIAVSGPVANSVSFTSIKALFGDLPGGSVYGVTGSLSVTGQTVFAVNLVDSGLLPVTLAGLAGGRPDPRFFMFPDGTAGVLLEATGNFYRLTQITSPDVVAEAR